VFSLIFFCPLIVDVLAMRYPGLGATVQPDAGWLMDLEMSAFIAPIYRLKNISLG
jgi:hypothetical protein